MTSPPAVAAFLHDIAASWDSLDPRDCVFVSGNEATDLDSTVCAVGYAYAMKTYDGRRLIPFVNCSSKAVIEMRGELQVIFKDYGVSSEELIYKDMVLDRFDGKTLDVFLLDHNELSTGWRVSHPNVAVNVVGIIDHHVDANQFTDAKPRIIETCGSNAALLMEYLHSNAPNPLRVRDIQGLLLSAIIYDTIGLTWRETSLDFKWAGMILGGSVDLRQDLVAKLAHPLMERFDAALIPETDFGLGDLLFKDYKLYSFSDGCYYGISTLRTSFETFLEGEFKGDRQAFTDTIKSFMAHEHIKLFSIALAVREPGSSSFYQQLGIFSFDLGGVDTHHLAEYLREAGAQLELIEEGAGYSLNRQNNPSISRKQLQPLFHKYLLSDRH